MLVWIARTHMLRTLSYPGLNRTQTYASYVILCLSELHAHICFVRYLILVGIARKHMLRTLSYARLNCTQTYASYVILCSSDSHANMCLVRYLMLVWIARKHMLSSFVRWFGWRAWWSFGRRWCWMLPPRYLHLRVIRIENPSACLHRTWKYATASADNADLMETMQFAFPPIKAWTRLTRHAPLLIAASVQPRCDIAASVQPRCDIAASVQPRCGEYDDQQMFAAVTMVTAVVTSAAKSSSSSSSLPIVTSAASRARVIVIIIVVVYIKHGRLSWCMRACSRA